MTGSLGRPTLLTGTTGSGKTERASLARVPTGDTGLDQMVGGGLFKDAIVLLTGPLGIGRTLTALHFADAGPPEERCLFCTFDETRGRLARNAASRGLDLEALQTRGSEHDQAIRQVTMDGAGTHIGEPLPRVAHVLSGSAALTEQPPWPAGPEPPVAGPPGGQQGRR
jgi:hypothetical protein